MSKPISFSMFVAILIGVLRALVGLLCDHLQVVTGFFTYYCSKIIAGSVLFISIIQALVNCLTCHFSKKIIAPVLSISTILIAISVEAQTPVQLAPPLLQYQSVFFKKTATAQLKFAMQGTSIYYTLNNKTPTKKDLIYRTPIQINQSFTTIKAMVFGDGFLPSEVVSATFIKDGVRIKSVQQTPANERYRGNGNNTLIDNAGGLTSVNSNTWLGYQTDSVQVDLLLASTQELSSIMINCLQDHGSWIFLPQQIQVLFFNDRLQRYVLVAEKTIKATVEIKGAGCVPILMPIVKKTTGQKIKIILKGIKSLPDWHQGKGQPGWLFIDEIKLY